MLPDWVHGRRAASRRIDLGRRPCRSTYDGPTARAMSCPATARSTSGPKAASWRSRCRRSRCRDWISVADNRVSVTTDAGPLHLYPLNRSRPSAISRAGSCSSSRSTARSTARAWANWRRWRVSGDRIDPDAVEPRLHGLGVLEQQDVAARGCGLGDLRDDPDGLPRHLRRRPRRAAAGLPCGARTSCRLAPLRFAMRRVFDFVRGVDGLIWTIILARAFGPGPMTGRARHRDHRHRHLRQDLLGSAGKHRRKAGRRHPLHRCRTRCSAPASA